MRIAFYAPMKPPDHPTASGDRTVARALVEALRLAGHEVETVSRFRSYDRGDPSRQARIRDVGKRLAERLVRRFKQAGTPDLWFTYHLYHKAPDWLGPAVSARLRIPYVVAEASYAPKQAGGFWDLGHRAAAEAIGQADRIFQLNPADAECVRPLLQSSSALVTLPPFLDTAPLRAPDRASSRTEMAARLGLSPAMPWLLTVAMMRADQKLLSYRCLADALQRIARLPWQIVIGGAGPAEADIRQAFAPLEARIRWVGILDSATLGRLYRAADVFAWPAIKEAWGMVLLEAQAAGLPVVAGRSGGVASVVAHGQTGLLTPEGDATAFADALAVLLQDPALRADLAKAAAIRAEAEHDIASAGRFLDRHLAELAEKPR